VTHRPNNRMPGLGSAPIRSFDRSPIFTSWTKQSPSWPLSLMTTRTMVLPFQCDDDQFPLIVHSCTPFQLTPKTTAKEGRRAQAQPIHPRQPAQIKTRKGERGGRTKTKRGRGTRQEGLCGILGDIRRHARRCKEGIRQEHSRLWRRGIHIQPLRSVFAWCTKGWWIHHTCRCLS